jgi:hypothetical protein
MFSKFLKKNKNYLDSKSKNHILHNVYLLYSIFIIALADIFYILQLRDFNSAAIFVGTGILISFFSKNMVVILSIAIIATHILKYGSKWKEGFEDGEDNTPSADTEMQNGEPMEEPMEEPIEEKMTESNEDLDNNLYLDDKKYNKDKLKELKQLEKTTNPTNINKLLNNQSILLDQLNEYKPLLNSIQNISKNLGLDSMNEEDE